MGSLTFVNGINQLPVIKQYQALCSTSVHIFAWEGFVPLCGLDGIPWANDRVRPHISLLLELQNTVPYTI